MINSYFQNNEVGMTKDSYYEMCEMLNTEPQEDQIPVEFVDFPDDIQQCFKIYYMLRDIWDPMGGNYLGKDMSTIFDLFRLYDMEKPEQLFTIDVIQVIDYERGVVIKSKQKPIEPQAKKA